MAIDSPSAPTTSPWRPLLDQIVLNRANTAKLHPVYDAAPEVLRKIDEMEWALQSIVENIMATPIGGPKE